ncbi:MAG: hypothetical protein QOG46_941 [Pseudonocardiales bacterium]|jgi:hypothetical protein|nr:hypothetical protein [Pseudonocardiales bacterium]
MVLSEPDRGMPTRRRRRWWLSRVAGVVEVVLIAVGCSSRSAPSSTLPVRVIGEMALAR